MDIDPATIAALISAAVTAAATTAEILTGVLSANKSSNPIACVFVNNTPYNWVKTVGFGECVHGELLQSPSATVKSLLDGAPDVLDEAKEYKEDNNTGWALKSKGLGSEVVIVYYCEELDIYASFYAKTLLAMLLKQERV